MIELSELVNESRLEEAFRRMRRAQGSRMQGFADTGMRLARMRQPEFMVALERATSILRKMSETQFGARGVDFNGVRVEATEYNFIRESYKAADEGQPLVQCAWFYGAVAWLAGLQR